MKNAEAKFENKFEGFQTFQSHSFNRQENNFSKRQTPQQFHYL